MYCRSLHSKKIKKITEEEFYFIPGTGIIEEVLRFVNETDLSGGNFGISSRNLRKAHLVKIDFDYCDLGVPIKEHEYEKKLIRGNSYLKNILSCIGPNTTYLEEKIRTRLKLSLFSNELISALADKAYINKDEKESVVNELIIRTKIVLQSVSNFFNNDTDNLINITAKHFIDRNHDIINQLSQEIIIYVKKHFEMKAQENIIKSLNEKAISVNNIIIRQ